MRATMLLMFALAWIPTVSASEPIDPKLGTSWQRTSVPLPKDGWSWLIWKNERGDLLTIAASSIPRQLTSHGDLDRAMDFASSAYPIWLDTTDFPSWGHEDQSYDPRFLKLKTDFVRHPADKNKRIPAISYVMVNDDGDRSFMVVGTVVCTGNLTYYIQHNSKRPISDDTVNQALRQVVAQTVSAPQK